MFKAAVIGIVLGTLLGFSVTGLPRSEYGVFNPYVTRFIEAGKSVGVKVDMGNAQISFLDELPHDFVGLCYPPTHEVTILKSYWDRADDAHREALIFHELGHCVLGREHNTTTKNGYIAQSIMNPALMPVVDDEIYYKEHRQEYITELFGK